MTPSANGDLTALWEKVNRIAEFGCAHRGDDLIRVEKLESWLHSIEKKLDRIFYGIISISIATAAFLLKASLFPGH